VLPRVVTVAFVMAERVLVGSLVALEQVLVEGVFRLTALGLAVGVVLLAGTGVYVFFLKPKDRA